MTTSTELRAEIEQVLRDHRPDQIDESHLLSHYLIVAEWSSPDSDSITVLTDGVTTAAHKYGMLLFAAESIIIVAEESDSD